VLAGPVDPDRACELAEELFVFDTGGVGKLPVSAAPAPRPGQAAFINHDCSLVQFRLSYPALVDSDPESAVQQALLLALDDGFSSLLPRRLVEERGLLYRVSADIDAYADIALIEVDAACAPDKVGEAARTLAQVLAECQAGAVDGEALERVQGRWRAHVRYGADSAPTLAAWLGGTALFHEPLSVAQRLARLDNVTVEQVRHMAGRLLSTPPAVAAVGRMPVRARSTLERLSQGS